MPQLVKGGKHVFGWSVVGGRGRVKIPPAALDEYAMHEREWLLCVPGSRTSGGFALVRRAVALQSPLFGWLDAHREFRDLLVPRGELIEHRGKVYCWLELRHGGVTLPAAALKKYGTEAGGKLLVVRGSGRALGFVALGPIFAAALRHAELELFTPDLEPVEHC
jgi:hypothetical protein